MGCGAGRVPVNLLIFGNQVVGVDRSEALLNFAIKNFPKNKFADLDFILADMCDLSKIPDASFDAVMFPMNSIDYIDNILMRNKAIQEAKSKIKTGGILALSSHSKLAYIFLINYLLEAKVSNIYLKTTFLIKKKLLEVGRYLKGIQILSSKKLWRLEALNLLVLR